MKKKIEYTDEPMGAHAIKDFLPPPEDLVLKEDNVKVTLTLSKKSVDFFKMRAQKYHTKYQPMIRKVVDYYVNHYAGRQG